MSDTDRDQLRTELRDLEYAEGYAESFLNSWIATQIKVIREQRKMTQAGLAAETGTTQTAISRIENVNYSAWNIRTLKKIAKALRVRLRVTFEAFGSLPEDMNAFRREGLERPEHRDDPSLWQAQLKPGPTAEVSTAPTITSNVLFFPSGASSGRVVAGALTESEVPRKMPVIEHIRTDVSGNAASVRIM
jgi:transcriptional regulator with XRE-family HTH domain